jgi:microcystin-dependent protein
MSYNIEHTDKTNYGSITVPDQAVNQETSLTFIGKNLPGYAQAIGENFLHLLENFASSYEPGTDPNNTMGPPVIGQLWYDTNINNIPSQPQLKVWDGNNWVAAGNVTKKIVRPTSAVIGDLWVDTSNQQLYLWSGSNWILVGPEFSSGAQTGPKVDVVDDTSNNPHTILSFIIGGQIVAIVSKDTFTPKLVIEGFTTINQGINMSSKDFDLDGTMLNKFWGTADRADKLVVSGYAQGLDANNFLRTDVTNTTGFGINIRNNAGLTLGADLNTVLSNSSNGSTVLFNKTEGSTIYLRVNQSGTLRDVLTVTGTTVGVNKTNPTEALDINGKIQTSDGLIVAATTDSTNLTTGSITTLGGASVAKTLYVGTGANVSGTLTSNNIRPSANNLYDLGTNSLRYKTIYANTVGNEDLTTVFRGSFSGAFNGSVTGTASRLTSATDFSLTGDISSNTISFNGAQIGGVATFNTVLSTDVISTKDQAFDSLSTDELLINRVGTGLKKTTKNTFLSKLPFVPVGCIMPFAGVSTAIPSGYLMCDGAEVQISQYPSLYSVIGNTYKGASPYIGVSTFRLPDLRGRFPLGADNMNNGIAVPLLPDGDTAGTTVGTAANRVTDVTADTVGLANGNEDKTIQTRNLPEHTHNLTGSNGTQFYAPTIDTTGSVDINDDNAVGRSSQMTEGFSRLLPNAGPVDAPQIDVPLNVMNPYLTINYIIFTGRID